MAHALMRHTSGEEWLFTPESRRLGGMPKYEARLKVRLGGFRSIFFSVWRWGGSGRWGLPFTPKNALILGTRKFRSASQGDMAEMTPTICPLFQYSHLPGRDLTVFI